MKKILLVIIMCLFLPLNCWAAEKISINDITLSGPGSIEEGKTFTIRVGGVYSGFNRTDFGVQGIYSAVVLFEFDEDVLILTDYSADSYESAVIWKDGLAYLYSEVNDSPTNKCADGYFNCGPYSAQLTFYVRNTDEEDTTIKIHALGFDVYEVLDEDEYDEDDVEEIICENSKSINLSIKQREVNVSPPQSAISDSLPSSSNSGQKKDNKVESEDKSEDKSEDSSKSDEKKELKFLKSLTVKGYKLDFKENKYTYEISLSDNVKKIEVEAIPYDSNATVKIVGADDLKTYSDIVKVRVELPDHEKMTYVINIKRESLSARESKSIVNKLNTVAAGIGGGVLFILLIVWFACSRDKKKLKKLLNDSKNENEMF